MAKVQVAKDDYSFYIATALRAGEELNYLVLPRKSHTLLVPKGRVHFQSTDFVQAPGIYKLWEGEALLATAMEDSIVVSMFLLDDDIMEDFFPKASVLSSLRRRTDNIVPMQFELPELHLAETLDFGPSGDITITTEFLETLVS